MSEKSSRRQFIDLSFRVAGLAGIGGAAVLLAKRAAGNAVFQVDPAKCAACDLCLRTNGLLPYEMNYSI